MSKQFYNLDDLVEMGIYESHRAFTLHKYNDPSGVPPHIAVSTRKYIFPKDLFLMWVKERLQGDVEWIEKKLSKK